MLGVVLAAGLAAAGVFDVREFGAVADGKTIDSPAINKAIEAAAAAGGGTVRLSAGTYLSASIRLKSHVGLHLDHGAVLIAASEKEATFDEPEPNEWGDKYSYQDFGHSHWQNSLIWGIDLEDVSITGPGLIWGRGLTRSNNAPVGAGNKAIGLKSCRRVTIRDVSILNGGHFGILATGVDDLTIDNVKIDTRRDGIDVDSCQNVRISNCHVNSPFDDGICLKASYGLGRARATKNVVITNCVVSGYDAGSYLDGTYKRTVRYGSGPTGRIKMGTESNGSFQNITISNCVFEYCRGLALEAVDGGSLEDIAISNLTMRDIANAPIFVRLGRRLRAPEGTPIGVARRIHIHNVVASNVTSHQGVLISGIAEHPIEDLRLSDIRIAYQGGGTAADAERAVPDLEDVYPEPSRFGRLPAYGFYARHVRGLDVHHVEVSSEEPEARPAFVLERAENARFDHVAGSTAPSVAQLRVKAVKDVQLVNAFGATAQSIAAAEQMTVPPEAPRAKPAAAEWIPLFDGKTLDGWTTLGGNGRFEVKDGAIVGTWTIGDESTYLATKQAYGDFDLEMEFKAEPGLNSGVQFRSLMNAEVKGKVQGYQYEIDPTPRALTGGLYDQSRRKWLVPFEGDADGRDAWKPKGEGLRAGEWNTLRIWCRGAKIRTFLNGQPMASLADDMTLKGFVALQVHHTKDEGIAGKTVAWRNIRLKPLTQDGRGARAATAARRTP